MRDGEREKQKKKKQNVNFTKFQMMFLLLLLMIYGGKALLLIFFLMAALSFWKSLIFFVGQRREKLLEDSPAGHCKRKFVSSSSGVTCCFVFFLYIIHAFGTNFHHQQGEWSQTFYMKPGRLDNSKMGLGLVEMGQSTKSKSIYSVCVWHWRLQVFLVASRFFKCRQTAT